MPNDYKTSAMKHFKGKKQKTMEIKTKGVIFFLKYVFIN